MGNAKNVDINKFLDTHLPYRLKLLMQHCESPCASPVGQYFDSCFISSLVTGRLLLEFLGIKLNYRTRQLEPAWTEEKPPRPDDVTVLDLRGTPVKLDSLSLQEKRLFVPYLLMANKAAAHLTEEIEHEYTIAATAACLIYDRVKAHVYQPPYRTFSAYDDLVRSYRAGHSAIHP